MRKRYFKCKKKCNKKMRSEKIICFNEKFKKKIYNKFVERRQRYFRSEIIIIIRSKRIAINIVDICKYDQHDHNI